MSGSFLSTEAVDSVGSTATYDGMPLRSVDSVRSKRPSVAVARYGAIGEVARHTNVLRPPAVVCEASTPLAITVKPAGTVTVKSYVALSRGLSLAGYHAGERCGSLTTNAPSSVGTQPSMDPSGTVSTDGTAPSPTTTVNAAPTGSPATGVITSSCPSREKVAGRPSTVSRSMSKPRRSRSKRDKFWVAVARIVAVPPSRRVAGS